jgi:hypothetical protein
LIALRDSPFAGKRVPSPVEFGEFHGSRSFTGADVSRHQAPG